MNNARSFGSLALAGALTTVAVGSVASRNAPSARLDTEIQAAATSSSGTDLFMKADTSRATTGESLLRAYYQHTADSAAHRDSDDIGVLITTLPDPIDSHLDHEFDVDLAAIRQAFEASGYVVDRFWLPWAMDREKAELAARQNRIDTSFYHRRWPGVILFRHVSKHELRLLYIVGEVPTSGIHAQAFGAALRDRKNLLAKWNMRPQSLQIVGPAFSGGAPSLREALLRDLATNPEEVSIMSGSATGNTVRDILQQHPQIHYQATVHTDSLLDVVQRNVLCGWLNIPTNQIAVLKESSTLYGALTLSAKPTAGDSTCRSDFLEVPFPANISTLRTEYARAIPGSDGSSGTQAQHLQLNLQDPARSMENPPVMSALTPAIIDGLLDEIARTLLHHRIRAVGILATDTRDKLFLAEQLRRRMHDLTLFTRESNILLVRRDINASLRGMLVFTTYPLELDAQRWDKTNPKGTRYAFGSSGAEGIFNATLFQLGNTDALAEYGSNDMGDAKLNCTPDQEDKTSASPSVPPVWVLAVGRSGFFPITACGVVDKSKLMPARPAPDSTEENSPPVARSGSYSIVCILLFVIGIFMPIVAYNELKMLFEEAPRRRADSVMRDIDWKLLSIQGHLYSILRVLALAVIGAALWFGLAHRLNLEKESPVALIIATVFCAVGGLLTLVGHGVGAVFHMRDAVPAIRKTPDEAGRRRWWSVIDLAGRALSGLTAVWYLWKVEQYFGDIHALGGSSGLRRALLLDRAGSFDGGFSPAMLLALVGGMFLLWCSWHMSRIDLLLASPGAFERASQQADVSGKVIHPPARWHKSMRAVRTHQTVLLPDWSSLFLAVVLFLVAIVLARTMFTSYEALLVPTQPEALFGLLPEGTHFDYLARFGLIAALCATTWSLFRASRIWLDLQRTLGKLGRTHLITAFERLPRRVARLTRLNVLRPHADVLVYSVSSTQWAHLKRMYEAIPDADKEKMVTGLSHPQRIGSRIATAGQYLTCLMQGSVTAWEGRRWAKDLNLTREEEFVRERTARGEEAKATRFLFDLTELRYQDEPTSAEIKTLVDRLGGEKSVEFQPRSTAGQVRRLFGDSARLWLRSAEEIVAVQAVNYIQWVMHHLRYLTLYIVASLILITQLLSSYVFQPASLLWLMLILLGIAATVVLLGIVISINRDEVLSRINGTAPGTVTWDLPFITNLSVIAIVPLLTFVGSAVPWLHDVLFSWVEPFVKALGRH